MTQAMTSEQYSQTFKSLTRKILAGACARAIVPEALLEMTGGSIVHDLEQATGTAGRRSMVEAYEFSVSRGFPVAVYAPPSEADRLVHWCWDHDVHVSSIDYGQGETVIKGLNWEVSVRHG